MVSQNEENLNKAKSLLQEQNDKVSIITIAKDLADSAAPQEIFDYTQQHAIQVDVLINNAGIQVYGKFHEVDIEDTLAMMNVNIFALTRLTRLYVEEMVKRGSGKILNVSSTGAFQPCPLNAAYCAAKAFVLYLSEAIAEEIKGTGVTITTLCPGATRTNFAKRADIEDIKLFRGQLLESSKVAEIGYKALMKNKSVVITGLTNKLVAESVRFMPRSVVTKIGMNVMKK